MTTNHPNNNNNNYRPHHHGPETTTTVAKHPTSLKTTKSADDTIKTNIVPFPTANTPTYATFASQPVIQAQNAPPPQPVHHSDLHPANPLPRTIVTPVNIENFSSALTEHPDQELCAYLINGLTHGFDIGYNGSHTASSPNNLRSALEHKDAVTTAICKELKRKHTSGPFSKPPIPYLHCSPLGSREKKDGTRRLIMDLSQPSGEPINEGISKDDFTVKYANFDHATELVYKLGKDCLLTKIDIQHAFRLLPVHPSQWVLLGIHWMDMYFVDTRLPFGLRSSPSIFNSFADTVHWILQNNYALCDFTHYSDDFLFAHGPSLQKANIEIQTASAAFHHLGIPTADEKTEGPACQITYLGIEIDSSKQIIRIPNDKYNDLIEMLPFWMARRKCTKKELLSFIGKLSFVCKVVRPGRIFLRRLIDTSTSVKKLHHHITLNSEARADIKWWLDFLPTWNKTSIIPDPFTILSSDIRLNTDASNLGFGAIYNNAWIQSVWPAKYTNKQYDIDFKELFTIVVATKTWGHNWKGKRIVFLTDNLPITQIWQAGSTKSPLLMTLIRSLYLIAARFQCFISFKHVYGLHNPIADALSRFQDAKFRELAPAADPQPTPLPPDVWEV